MNIEELRNAVSSFTDAEIGALEATINQSKAARVATRNESLEEFPLLVPALPVGVSGRCAPMQVTKSRAIELLATGRYTVYTPDTVV